MQVEMRIKTKENRTVCGEGLELSILFKELLLTPNPLTFILLPQIQV